MKKMILAIFVLMLTITAVSVQGAVGIGLSPQGEACEIRVVSKDTASLLNEIPSINDKLTECPVQIPSQMKHLIAGGSLAVIISDNQDISISISDLKIQSVKVEEKPSYTSALLVSSCQLDAILSSEDPVSTFVTYYSQGKAKVTVVSFTGKLKLFFGKFFFSNTLKEMEIEVPSCN